MKPNEVTTKASRQEGEQLVVSDIKNVKTSSPNIHCLRKSKMMKKLDQSGLTKKKRKFVTQRQATLMIIKTASLLKEQSPTLI